MYSSASYMYITLGRWLHPCTRQKQTRFQKYTIIRYYIFLILSVFWQRSVLYWDMKRKLRFYNMSFKSRWLMRDISDGWNIRNSRWWCAALWCKPWCWAFLLFLLLSWNLTFTCAFLFIILHILSSWIEKYTKTGISEMRFISTFFSTMRRNGSWWEIR